VLPKIKQFLCDGGKCYKYICYQEYLSEHLQTTGNYTAGHNFGEKVLLKYVSYALKMAVMCVCSLFKAHLNWLV